MSPKKNILLRNIHGYGPKEKIAYVVQGIGAGIVTLIMLFPLYWMLVTSFKTGEVLLGHGIDLLPSFPISFENYVEAWTRVPLGRYIYNTVMTTAIAMTFKVVTGVLAAYGAVGVIQSGLVAHEAGGLAGPWRPIAPSAKRAFGRPDAARGHCTCADQSALGGVCG